ncbi:MAG: GNAT family N-acetyltransferase [Oscillospiraceae bacterium]|nr:GNAT family N-acetyltransferase [Oscillospiraceae bacterium]
MNVENGELKLVFQKAAPEDAPILTETRRRVWDATYRGIYPDEMIDDYDYPFHSSRDLARISDPKNVVWLAMDGADCVGYLYVGPCGYGPYKDFDFCLNSLYFLPPYQHRGLGKLAFALVTEECRRFGFDKFFCGCNAHNFNARSFYEHMGGVLGAQSVGHENKAEDQVYYEFYLNADPSI